MLPIKQSFLSVAALVVFPIVVSAAAPLKVLSIDIDGGYAHGSAITAAVKVLKSLATEKGFTLALPDNGKDTSSTGYLTAGGISPTAELKAKLNDDSLSSYQVIILNNAGTIDHGIVDTGQRQALQRWLKHGGGMVAWHQALYQPDYSLIQSDYSNYWSWLVDSVLSGISPLDHSPWNSTAGKQAIVQWDTTHANGIVAANKPEYADLKKIFPSGPLNYPDGWYSFRPNPRNALPGAGGISRVADILLTIDENTVDLPSVVKMGADHPIAWAYTLPPDLSAKRGRFIYFARGFEASAFTGTGAGAAPNGIDTGSNGLMRNWMWQSIRWAAGLTQNPTSIPSIKSIEPELFHARNENGILKVAISGMGKHIVVELFDLSGHKLGHQTGDGNREYSFPNLKHSNVYLIRANSGKQSYSKRVLF